MRGTTNRNVSGNSVDRARRRRSTNGVNEHVTSLERKGLVVRAPRTAMSLRLTAAGAQALKGEK